MIVGVVGRSCLSKVFESIIDFLQNGMNEGTIWTMACMKLERWMLASLR